MFRPACLAVEAISTGGETPVLLAVLLKEGGKRCWVGLMNECTMPQPSGETGCSSAA